MADSTCLMQPFSYTSGFSNESMEGKSIQALGQSVSFGRFTSESLAWEKWSTFSHNRYVEEAERFSRPGSVAQKKAFFEAHYRKVAAQKAAAALLEQEESTHSKSVEGVEKELNSNNVHDELEVQASNSDSGIYTLGEKKVEEAEQVVIAEEHKLLEEKPETDFPKTPEMEKPLLKSLNCNHEEDQMSTGKKKTTLFSSSKLSMFSRASQSSQNNVVTPIQNSKMSEINTVDKKRSTPKSVSFTPIRELNKLTSTVMRKIERSRAGPHSSKVSKECSTPQKTPIMASSKKEEQKHTLATPCSEKRSSKFFSGYRNKTQPQFSSTPFSFRTEERAARRKEKLEEKFNTNESQKVQLQTTLKEKAEIEYRKLRQTLCFKARPLPDFYKERKVVKNETKDPVTHNPQSLKLGRKHEPKPESRAKPNPNANHNPGMRDGSTSLPAERSLAKTCSNSNNVKGKKTHSVTLRSIMNMAHENTSPNIQN